MVARSVKRVPSVQERRGALHFRKQHRGFDLTVTLVVKRRREERREQQNKSMSERKVQAKYSRGRSSKSSTVRVPPRENRRNARMMCETDTKAVRAKGLVRKDIEGKDWLFRAHPKKIPPLLFF